MPGCASLRTGPWPFTMGCRIPGTDQAAVRAAFLNTQAASMTVTTYRSSLATTCKEAAKMHTYAYMYIYTYIYTPIDMCINKHMYRPETLPTSFGDVVKYDGRIAKMGP